MVDKKNIMVYVDYDAWKTLTDKGVNISELCSNALVLACESPIISIETLEQKRDQLVNKVDIDKEGKIKALNIQIDKLRAEKIIKRKIDTKPEYIREAIKKGITDNSEILKYVEQKQKEDLENV